MRKLGVTVVCGGMLFGALTAHAAPVGPAPTPSTVRVPSGPIVGLGNVTADVVPGAVNSCGKPQQVRVKLVNTTKQAWNGVINFVPTMKAVSLGPAGSDTATQVQFVDGPVLDCKKPLASQSLRVWKTGAETTPILTKVLKPKTVAALVGYDMPPNATQPWLRRAELQATCDGPVNAKVHVQGGAQQQQVQLKLGFGIYVSQPSVSVPANQPTIVPAVVPKPLDCSAPGGIPAFEYSLLQPAGEPGTLEAKEVSFE